MICGIGNDIIDIRRIEKTYNKFGKRFATRIFTTGEQQKANARKNKIATYAKRFAAKEACAKALGTGISQGVFWKNIEVKNKKNGKPYIELTNGAKKMLAKKIPQGKQANIHLTLSDDYPMAQAIVIIEAI